MRLTVSFGGVEKLAETWEERARLIAEVLENLEPERPVARGIAPGNDAWFALSDPPGPDRRGRCSHLRVAANRSTGYGALIWFVTMDDPRRGGVYEHVWVSDNATPPDFDPRVVSDPGYPLFHDPASALPIPRVRAALEEYCRSATGERPGCVDWVEGHMNGQRLDRPSITEDVEDHDPFA
ncbi:Imm1 family immunity protein [Streptomyces coeruleoprunus]|uniref:Imm1 family immunity protein n=1 Tax=Streptomyces coeruleoprunus TaxID=285563 RepID=A0ABV9X8Y9_9ACTN